MDQLKDPQSRAMLAGIIAGGSARADGVPASSVAKRALEIADAIILQVLETETPDDA